MTWNNSTDWATSASDEATKDSLAFTGLTDFGRDVVRKCNELGVLVDVSHAGVQTFWDIINTTSKPIIASHSCSFTLCPHYRNLTDEQLFAMKENNGVVFINFYPGYLDSAYEDRAAKVRESYKDTLEIMKEELGEYSDAYWYGAMELMAKDMQSVAPPVDRIIDHIDYMVDLIGVDHVGLGSDFDGVSVLPRGIEDASKLPVITEKLIERGYSESDIKKILGENFKRVFRDAAGD